eukprot:351209-Chlamydomonas_euryale.AAC.2
MEVQMGRLELTHFKSLRCIVDVKLQADCCRLETLRNVHSVRPACAMETLHGRPPSHPLLTTPLPSRMCVCAGGAGSLPL